MIVSKLLILLAFHHIVGSCYPVTGSPLNYEVGQTYKYSYNTDTVINVPDPSPKTKQGVGFKFSATIEVTPLWSGDGHMLTKLQIFQPKIHSIARPQLAKVLQGLPRQPVFFEWVHSKVSHVYASEDDSTLAVNIKKGIISIFHLDTESGVNKEVDASGECRVQYARSGPTITKIKTNCQSGYPVEQFSTVSPLMSVKKSSQHKTVYSCSVEDDIIKTAKATEAYTLSLSMEETVSSVISVNQELKLEKVTRASALSAANFDEAVALLNKKYKLGLYGMVLSTTFEATQKPVAQQPLSDVVNKHRVHLQPSNVGSVESAYSFIELVSAFRQSNKDDVVNVLKNADNQDVLGSLLDVAAAAQTSATRKAVMEILKFDDSYYIDNPERYILAVAFSTHPSEELLQDLLKLYKSDIPSEKLYESIGEALGAVVYTYCKLHQPCHSKVVKEAIKTFIENVESCAKPACKPMAIRALANAGIPDTIPTLLRQSEHCTDMTVCEAAIKALRRMGKEHMNEEVKNVMRRIFFQKKRGYDTAVRSRALNIILDNSATLEDITAILSETTDPHNTEYDVYVQARLFNIIDSDQNIKIMLKEALKDGTISNYHILAPKGKSLAFTNTMAETSSILAKYFMFLENSRASIIKRSGMDVIAYGKDNNSMLVYGFGIFAAGLESLLGEEVDKEDEDITATAGMSLDLMEVSLRPLTFFTGSGGLMSAVWSAPSEPVSALQINILLTDHVERLHLQNGLIIELSVQGALSLDLSGSLTVSLWNKNSKSLISNRVALAIQASTSLKTSPFRADVQISSDASSLIDFQTDVDFYDKIKMCLQMSRPESLARKNVTKFERAHGFKKSYVARSTKTRKINSLSYPLPKPNNVQCRNMLGEQ